MTQVRFIIKQDKYNKIHVDLPTTAGRELDVRLYKLIIDKLVEMEEEWNNETED